MKLSRRQFLETATACGVLTSQALGQGKHFPLTLIAQYNRDRDTQELSLRHLGDGRRIATWIDSDSRGERISWRIFYSEGDIGPVVSTHPEYGAPTSPQCCGPLLLWNEFQRGAGRGRTLWAHVDIYQAKMSEPQPVALLTDVNCGEFSCALGSRGKVWLLCETWREKEVVLRLISYDGEKWNEHGLVGGEKGFRIRPRLYWGVHGLMAAWDEFAQGSYHVITTDLSGGTPIRRELPTLADHWDTLPAIACAGDGTWYAARCREKLVEFTNRFKQPYFPRTGIATFHSELVLSVLRRGEDDWSDVASVDIDHGMNPWEAPYTGKRRFPTLLPRERGVWLLWEEKEHPKVMRPSPGRFCAWALSEEGGQASPIVAIEGRCMFVAESGGSEKDLLVASKTQFRFREMPLPYHLHRVNLDRASERRPENLDSNKAAPTFAARPIRQGRPILERENLRLYFGDPHLHSRFSGDLDGEQDELYHFARHIAKVDFAAFTENDFHWLMLGPLSDATWEQDRRNTAFFNEPGVFTTLLGWEYTLDRDPETDPKGKVLSHRSVLFPGTEGEIYTWHKQKTSSAPVLVKRFRGKRVLLHHHHPEGYDITDNSLERNIEICSGWSNNMMIPQFVDNLHKLLGRGLRLGFVGASDNHERNPGLGGPLSGVWATENTREGIFEAFWNRRIFATTGLRPDFRFWVSEAFMGGDTRTNRPPVIHVYVDCDTPVREVKIIRDGSIVHTVTERKGHLEFEWADRSCPPGKHYYYVHVLFGGKEKSPYDYKPQRENLYGNLATAYGVHAWSSPVWVELG